MKKTIILTLILSIFVVILSGCYDAQSVDNYSYVIAIGLDKSDSQKLKLSLQFANSSRLARILWWKQLTIK